MTQWHTMTQWVNDTMTPQFGSIIGLVIGSVVLYHQTGMLTMEKLRILDETDTVVRAHMVSFIIHFFLYTNLRVIHSTLNSKIVDRFNRGRKLFGKVNCQIVYNYTYVITRVEQVTQLSFQVLFSSDFHFSRKDLFQSLFFWLICMKKLLRTQKCQTQTHTLKNT